MGVFEFDNYKNGTQAVAQALVDVTATEQTFTLIGGGDSAAAFKQLINKGTVSFVSTGGGASLAYMEGSPLPGVESIQNL